ncbi:hypothetical protein ACWEOE_17100 [Amycolatopsis sp. NPDC004368]
MRTLLLLAGALVLLTACGTPAPVPPPVPRPKSRAIAVGPRERAYVAALRAIDPALAPDEVRAIVHAHELCDARDHATALADATWYFTTAEVTVDPALAERIVATAAPLC